MLDELNKKVNESKGVNEAKKSVDETKNLVEDTKRRVDETKTIFEDKQNGSEKKSIEEKSSLEKELLKGENQASNTSANSSSSVGSTGAISGAISVAAVSFVLISGGSLIGGSPVDCNISFEVEEKTCEVFIDVSKNESQNDIYIEVTGDNYSKTYTLVYAEQEISDEGTYSNSFVFYDLDPGEKYTTYVSTDSEFGKRNLATASFTTSRHEARTRFISLTDLGFDEDNMQWSFIFDWEDDNNYYSSFEVTLESSTGNMLTKHIEKENAHSLIAFDITEDFIGNRNILTIFFNTEYPDVFGLEENIGVLKQAYVNIRKE